MGFSHWFFWVIPNRGTCPQRPDVLRGLMSSEPKRDRIPFRSKGKLYNSVRELRARSLDSRVRSSLSSQAVSGMLSGALVCGKRGLRAPSVGRRRRHLAPPVARGPELEAAISHRDSRLKCCVGAGCCGPPGCEQVKLDQVQRKEKRLGFITQILVLFPFIDGLCWWHFLPLRTSGTQHYTQKNNNNKKLFYKNDNIFLPFAFFNIVPSPFTRLPWFFSNGYIL